jgi:hypothetical protein
MFEKVFKLASVNGCDRSQSVLQGKFRGGGLAAGWAKFLKRMD